MSEPEQALGELADPSPEVQHRHAELSDELNLHIYRYHVLDSPLISDAVYDQMMRELRDIEERFPQLRTPDSASQKVGGAISTDFAAV